MGKNGLTMMVDCAKEVAKNIGMGIGPVARLAAAASRAAQR